MADYEIFIESMVGERTAQLPFESLNLTLRFNEPGKGRITLPYSVLPDVDLFGQPYRLLIRRNGENLMSGMITTIARNWNGREDAVDIGITDDLALLAGRLIVPVPSGPPYTASDHDVRTGAIETVMHQYVYYHAGAGAKTERQIAGLTQSADQGRGDTITARVRFVSLLKTLQGLAYLGGFGIRLVGLQFEVYQPVDKTASVIFSREMNNLIQFSRTISVPEHGNYVYVGGSGEGTARIIVERGDSTSITRWGRIEAWKDQRNLTNTAELDNTAVRFLAESTEKEENIQFSAYASLDSVMVGDMISVAFDGIVYTDTVKQITINYDGVSENVTIASGDSKPGIYRRMDDVEENLTLLEVQ